MNLRVPMRSSGYSVYTRAIEEVSRRDAAIRCARVAAVAAVLACAALGSCAGAPGASEHPDHRSALSLRDAAGRLGENRDHRSALSLRDAAGRLGEAGGVPLALPDGFRASIFAS